MYMLGNDRMVESLSLVAREFKCRPFKDCLSWHFHKILHLEAQNLLGCTAVFLIECRPTFQRYVLASIIKAMSDHLSP
jgi:hypothetical protein